MPDVAVSGMSWMKACQSLVDKQFSKRGAWAPEILKTPSGICKVRTIFRIILCALFTCWHFYKWWKSNGGKSAGSLAWISGPKLYSWSLHSLLSHPYRKGKLLSLMNILDEAVKIINFIKSQPFSSHISNILFDELGGVCKHLYSSTANWTSHFFVEHHAELERITNRHTLVI